MNVFSVVLAKARTCYPNCLVGCDAGASIPLSIKFVVMGPGFRQDDGVGSSLVTSPSPSPRGGRFFSGPRRVDGPVWPCILRGSQVLAPQDDGYRGA